MEKSSSKVTKKEILIKMIRWNGKWNRKAKFDSNSKQWSAFGDVRQYFRL